MHCILCHQTADFDALGAAVGLSCLDRTAKIVLTGGAHPGVKAFLALYRDQFPLLEARSLDPGQIRHLSVVDAQAGDRLGTAASWLDRSFESFTVYDHHPEGGDLPATERYIEPVGATTTIIVERLAAAKITPRAIEATAMALGIHADTGSLTYAQTTPRDARALTWLLERGADVKIIAESLTPGLSPQLQDLLSAALERLQKQTVLGAVLAWVLLESPDFVPGLSSIAAELIDLTESDVLLLGHRYTTRSGKSKLTLIGRSHLRGLDLTPLFASLGGGGHPQAASVTLSTGDPQGKMDGAIAHLKELVPNPPTARDLMSSPVRTVRPETTIGEAQRVLLRYGHSGLSVVDEEGKLVGIISRRDLDLALHHGFDRAPVKGYMSRNLKTIAPDTLLPEIQSLMVTYDVGRLPVIQQGELVGIVTRTDVMRHLQRRERSDRPRAEGAIACLLPALQERLSPALWQLLARLAAAARERGWHLYLVGGGVRDLLLTPPEEPLVLQDIDLVVDGFHAAADVGAGVELASVLQQDHPQARLEVHGEFQTAALSWHHHPEIGSPLLIDIATARTEFYPYPAANPEVEASSIQQDLYRRDFTINALALRLSEPNAGELLDFFGGVLDLKSRLIRVLHANSFIEDPTRIYRAVRFAVRLGFQLEGQTRDYIDYAIAARVYDRILGQVRAPALQTRLKAELKYLLQAPYWRAGLQLLGELKALRCLHPQLTLDRPLAWQMRYLSRLLRRFDPEHTLPHWQMRLEILLAALPVGAGVAVAENLQLSADSIKRLHQLPSAHDKAIVLQDPSQQRPSQVVKLLRSYQLPLLLLLAAREPRQVRASIWRYLATWQQVRAPLDGNDLKALGYRPSPQFRQMLDELLWVTLDGQLSQKEEAIAYLQAHFSLPGEPERKI